MREHSSAHQEGSCDRNMSNGIISAKLIPIPCLNHELAEFLPGTIELRSSQALGLTYKRGERGKFARLHYNRATTCKSGCCLPSPHHNRVVPWDAIESVSPSKHKIK